MDDSEVPPGHTSPVAVGCVFHRRSDTLPVPGPGLRDHPDTKSCMRNLLFSPSSSSSFSSPCSVLSPVTNLAFNMDNLAGLGGRLDTPKRSRPPAPLLKIPSFASDASSDAGLCMDSPSPMDALDMEDTFEKAIQKSSNVVNGKMPIRRIQSLPVKFLNSSPVLKGQELDPHRFGVFTLLPPGDEHPEKENMPEEGFEFKKPTRPVSRSRLRSVYGGHAKEAFAQRPNSAPALMLSPTPAQRLEFPDDSSPVFLRRPSLACSPGNRGDDEEDDGFLEALDDDGGEGDKGMPRGMASLLTAPLVADKMADKMADDSVRKMSVGWMQLHHFARGVSTERKSSR
ncbi:hypothetical protein CRUP_004541 [Coryphaenoides rupestris]|nr:hypothetical protein CRUP_004541 [Coryphaenoides rupestris]